MSENQDEQLPAKPTTDSNEKDKGEKPFPVLPPPSEPQPKTVNTKQATAMEVHKHPHHVMHSKKISEYVLEFFMLFLAVFLGFVAENIREGIVEKEKGKEFARQLVDGLKLDTANLAHTTRINQIQLKDYDSLLYLASLPDNTDKWDRMYKHIANVVGAVRFKAQQASFDQIKNSGALRYFKNQALVKKLAEYRFWIDLLENQQDGYTDFSNNQLRPFLLNNIDYNKTETRFNSHLTTSAAAALPAFTNNPDKVRLFRNLLIEGREIFLLPKRNLESTLRRVEELIKLLEEEYHFEK